MIDFWAAWCPDCRAENPNIVAVYNDFKDKGLDIISVSLDTDKNAWTKAIANDNLSWENHVSELKGWDCSAATEYGVAWIPQNFLIDNNGIIVAKNLNGEDLRIFVENYLK
jgi:thiol-disulfide isomerase/thioredoxin